MRTYVFALGFALVTACSRDGAQSPDAVLTEHRFAAAGAKTRQLGEDCTQAGSLQCASGICLHVEADRNAGYVCSKACSSSSDCPPAWGCIQVFPAPDSSFCVPSTRLSRLGVQP
jgi:hypothetical protein